MSELEPLPPDLRDLFADERAAYVEDAASKARVLRRIEVGLAFAGGAAVGGAAGAVASAADGAAKTLEPLSFAAANQAKIWLALSLAAGIVVGEIHGRQAVRTEAESLPPRVSTLPTAPIAATPSTATEPSPSASAASIAISDLPAAREIDAGARAAKAPGPASDVSDLGAEQRLIDTMRSALARGRGDDALRAASEHDRRFARGKLAEEREMLAIQALLLTGDRANAESRAARFRQRYPDSMFRGAVDALLAAKPRDGG